MNLLAVCVGLFCSRIIIIIIIKSPNKIQSGSAWDVSSCAKHWAVSKKLSLFCKEHLCMMALSLQARVSVKKNKQKKDKCYILIGFGKQAFLPQTQTRVSLWATVALNKSVLSLVIVSLSWSQFVITLKNLVEPDIITTDFVIQRNRIVPL